jgi:DNA polymerase V
MQQNSGSSHAASIKRRRIPKANRPPTSPIPLRSLPSLSLIEAIVRECWRCSDRTHYCLNLYQQPIPAGFPSPADDYLQEKLDLNKHLIKHPAATFFVKVTGYSMVGAGIHDGDMLIVDRALEPTNGRIIIAVINGELTVKRLQIEPDRILLVAENLEYPPIQVQELDEMTVWGVVVTVIHMV